MDSQLTLLDAYGPIPSEEDIVLIFDRDDTSNTTLRIRDADQSSYSVDTFNEIMTVYARDNLIATVTRRRFRPDQITFPGMKPTKLGNWLKGPILWCFPLKFRVHGRRFKWREDHHGQIVLRESGRPDCTLAWFSKSRIDSGGRLMHAAYLAIVPEMVEMTDMIVLSCLLAEHKLRAITAARGKTVLDIMFLTMSRPM